MWGVSDTPSISLLFFFTCSLERNWKPQIEQNKQLPQQECEDSWRMVWIYRVAESLRCELKQTSRRLRFFAFLFFFYPHFFSKDHNPFFENANKIGFNNIFFRDVRLYDCFKAFWKKKIGFELSYPGIHKFECPPASLQGSHFIFITVILPPREIFMPPGENLMRC